MQLFFSLFFGTARAILNLAMAVWLFTKVFVGDSNLERFQKWLWGTPLQQQQPQVSQEIPAVDAQVEALYVVFQHQMDMLYEMGVLRRETLTLPALPDENN